MRKCYNQYVGIDQYNFVTNCPSNLFYLHYSSDEYIFIVAIYAETHLCPYPRL